MQRTVTVTPRGRQAGRRLSDLRWGRRPKLHGMQGVRGSNPLSSTTTTRGNAAPGNPSRPQYPSNPKVSGSKPATRGFEIVGTYLAI
jgi:hypothetical protein